MTEAEQPRSQDFASRVQGADATNATTNTSSSTTEPVTINNANRDKPSTDPFAAQRTAENDPFAERSDSVGNLPASPTSPSSPPGRDRRMSKEWDASKVPPSRFQKREGSLYATPGSRDAHTSTHRNQAFFDKLKEKGWK
ncbi:MAG: hypothetical protein M1817_005268 [Caeruleum heppii]|nr:MAG: hypothetical protein M1817_005268 [Caeruleum heppii]